MLKDTNAGLISGLSSDREARIIWSAIIEPPDIVAHQLIASAGSISSLQKIQWAGGSRQKLAAIALEHNINPNDLFKANSRWEPRLQVVNLGKIKSLAKSHGMVFVIPSDRQWPPQMDSLGEGAPLGLWARGELPTRIPAALVGARISSSYGESVAHEFAYELSRSGAVVASGGAFGIDASAHRGALAGAGNTVAFMAGGLDRLYPSDLADIHYEIIENGAVISEFPPGSRPARWRFLTRNRLLAAYAATTVVVEANIRSGALNTARTALGMGRPVGAVPGSIHSQLSNGTNQLLRDGGVPVLRVENIIEMMAEAAQAKLPFEMLKSDLEAGVDTAEKVELTSAQKRIYDSLPPTGTTSVTRICVSSGISSAEVLMLLGQLELAGLVVSQGTYWGRS